MVGCQLPAGGVADAIGILGVGDEFAHFAVIPFAGAGRDISAQVALDGGALFVLRNRADNRPN